MTETGYPLVDERPYGRPQNRVGRFRKRYVRSDGDLPGLAAHHVRVFRIGDRYIEEHGLAGPEDETVVNASSVTVVDCRVRVPVVAELELPSSGVDVFTLHITFLCTVRNAGTVVRDGVTDAANLLKGYVREIPGLDDEAADLPTTEVAQVRRKVEARLTAYLEMRPPALSGLEVVFSELVVLSPEDLATHLRVMEKGALERQRELFEAERVREREESLQRYKLMEERHRQELARLETDYAEQLRARTQNQNLTLTAQRNDFRRAETVEDLRIIGNDPAAADLNAVNAGDMNTTEYADRLRGREERELDRRREDRLFDREDHRYLVEREDRFREVSQQDLRADKQADREDFRYRLEREDRIRELDYRNLRTDKDADRDDIRYRLEREDRVRELDYQDLRADKDADRADSRLQSEREERLRELERQDLRAEQEAARVEAARRWNEEFVEEQRRFREDRENQLTERQAEWRRQQQVLQTHDNLVRLLVSRGAADDQPMDVADMIRRVGELPAPPEAAEGGGQPSAAVSSEKRRTSRRSVATHRPDDEEAVIVEVESVERTAAEASPAGPASPADPDDEDEYGEAGTEDRPRGD